jgi:hypothetical protein
MGRGGEAVDGVDAQFVETWKSAEQWLRDVAKGIVEPLPKDPQGNIEDGNPTTGDDPIVETDCLRGW